MATNFTKLLAVKSGGGNPSTPAVGDTLTLGFTAFNLTAPFDLTGAFDVLGDSNLDGNATLTGTLAVTGMTTLNDSLAVTKHVTIGGNLTVAGTTISANQLNSFTNDAQYTLAANATVAQNVGIVFPSQPDVDAIFSIASVTASVLGLDGRPSGGTVTVTGDATALISGGDIIALSNFDIAIAADTGMVQVASVGAFAGGVTVITIENAPAENWINNSIAVSGAVGADAQCVRQVAVANLRVSTEGALQYSENMVYGDVPFDGYVGAQTWTASIANTGSFTNTGAVSVIGPTNLDGALDVTGIADFSAAGGGIGTEKFKVAGVALFSDAVYMASSLSVSGTLGVTGLSTLDSLSVTNNASVGGTFGASTLGVTGTSTLGVLAAGSTTLDGLAVSGGSSFSTVAALGAVILNDILSVTKEVTLSSTLDVTGVATFQNSVTSNGTLTAENELVVNGDYISIAKAEGFSTPAANTGSVYVAADPDLAVGFSTHNELWYYGGGTAGGVMITKNGQLNFDVLTFSLQAAYDDGSAIITNGDNGAVSIMVGADLTDALDVTGNVDIVGALDASGLVHLTSTGGGATPSGTPDLWVEGYSQFAEVWATGALGVGGTLAVTGASTLTGAATLSSTLDVDNKTSITSSAGTAASSGNADLNVTNYLWVGGASAFGAKATIESLEVTNASALKSTLDVVGDTTVTKLTASGDASLVKLTASGATGLASLTASGFTSLESATKLSTADADLKVAGYSSFAKDAKFAGAVELVGALSASSIAVSGNLTVGGTSSFDGGVFSVLSSDKIILRANGGNLDAFTSGLMTLSAASIASSINVQATADNIAPYSMVRMSSTGLVAAKADAQEVWPVGVTADTITGLTQSGGKIVEFGQATVLVENGKSIAKGDRLYLSAIDAGCVTNAQPVASADLLEATVYFVGNALAAQVGSTVSVAVRQQFLYNTSYSA